jgi:hypothetical protein
MKRIMYFLTPDAVFSAWGVPKRHFTCLDRTVLKPFLFEMASPVAKRLRIPLARSLSPRDSATGSSRDI